MIGTHLVIDGVAESRIGKDDVERLLKDLPEEMDMHILAGPMVVKGVPENPGWTGFAIIDKSHIVVHTFEEGELVSVDVFSCKPFETGRVLRYIVDRLGMTRVNSMVIIRSETRSEESFRGSRENETFCGP